MASHEERRPRRAAAVLARQLAYQQEKARRPPESLAELARQRQAWALEVQRRLAPYLPPAGPAAVLEVGSGAHGLIFFLPFADAVGIDPLAHEYARLFPEWQSRAATLAAAGEQLPFADASFDLVLCDNVIDHASDPRGIVVECVRVLRPGGLLFFTVHAHHLFWRIAAGLYDGLQALGLPISVQPFDDHTVHFTVSGVRRALASLPLQFLEEAVDPAEARRAAATTPLRHAGDLAKRLFFKNAPYLAIARRV